MARRLSEILAALPGYQGVDPATIKSNFSEVIGGDDPSRRAKIVADLQKTPEYQGWDDDSIVKHVSDIVGVQPKAVSSKPAQPAPEEAEKQTSMFGPGHTYKNVIKPKETLKAPLEETLKAPAEAEATKTSARPSTR